MNPEKEEVQEEWEYDQSERSVREMTVEVGLMRCEQVYLLIDTSLVPQSTHHGVTLFNIENLP